MGYEIEKSVQAARDIEEAFVYIGEENLDAAVYFLVAVEESIEIIASHPLIGSSRHFQNIGFSYKNELPPALAGGCVNYQNRL